LQSIDGQKKGILLQGSVFDCTKDIVEEYKKKFLDVQILLSTWTTEDIDKIPCEVVQSDPPETTSPYHSNVNHQKVGTLAGLQKMSCDIIMKCRTDQFIHNKKILTLYQNSCPNEKIMITNYATFETIDYWASDFCQIATKNILIEYWNSIPYYDGSFPAHAEIFLTGNYILRGKKNTDSWKNCLKKYFFVKDYQNDFQIEWKKLKPETQYQKTFDMLYSECVKADS